MPPSESSALSPQDRVGAEWVPALAIYGIRRTFGSKVAVDNAELTVRPGSFTGLLGPNGAGKSTLIGCTVGFDRPDRGTSEIFGVDIWHEPLPARRLLGVLPDNLALPEHLSARELLGYWGRLHGLDADVVDSRASSLLGLLELDGSAERTLVLDYSTGMRKKIGLAVALIHRPRLLVLDEPFEAIDPLTAIMIRQILERFIANGGSVVMSSHSMLLVEQLCDSVAIMAAGQIVRSASMAQIKEQGTLEEAFHPLCRPAAGAGSRGAVVVGVIVRLHLALSRHRMTRSKGAQIGLGATLGLALAVATVVLAFLRVPDAARADLLAVALGLWLVGWLVAPSFTGGPELTGQYFRLHPVPRSTLTRGLFVAAWTGLPAIVTLVAFGVLIAVAAPLGPAALLVALVAMVLSVAVLVIAARLTAIWFAAVSRSRLGAAISSVVTAAIIVVAQHSWLIILAIVIHLDTGVPGVLGAVLRALPSSWGLVAVTAAGEGTWGVAAAAVAGLFLLGGALYLLWTRVVTSAPIRGAVVRPPQRSRAPALGSTRKEVLGWLRNPLRVQDLALALAYAIGTCALPLIVDFGGLLPFLGVVTMIMGAATSCNLYGSDGTALWMLLAIPGSERGDVRGRQRAWLLVFGGLGVLLTAVGFALHPDPALLPWVLGVFLAVLGAGAGLSVFLSVYAPVPTRDPHTAKHSPAEQGDAAGPAFLAIFLTLLVAAPTVAVLAAGAFTGNNVLSWAGVALGLLTAVLAPVLLGAAATRRLTARGPELLHRMQSGPQRPDVAEGAGATTRAALREALGGRPEAVSTDGEGDAEPTAVSGFEAMRPGEELTFWALYVAAVLALVPQGLVAGGHLLADSDVTSWFVALRVAEGLQWPAVGGFLLLGALLAALAMVIYSRAKRREQRRRDATATPDDVQSAPTEAASAYRGEHGIP